MAYTSFIKYSLVDAYPPHTSRPCLMDILSASIRHRTLDRVMAILILLTLLSSITFSGLIFYERYIVQGFLDNFTLLLLAGAGSVAFFCITSLALLPTARGERVRKFWLGLLATGLTYAAADILAGLALIPPLSPALVGDQIVHHRLLPNTHSALYSRDFSYIQRVNNMGLRGRETSVQKTPGTRRIALLGDSFIMGKGVEDEETAAAVLEHALRQDGHLVEVLNGGVDSYAPILSLLQLRTLFAPLDLDLVVLNLDMGDLLQEQAYRGRAAYDKSGRLIGVDGRLDGIGLPRTQRWRNWINEHLYFSRLFVYYIQHWAHRHRGVNVANVVGMANPTILAHTLASDTDSRDEQWRLLFSSILDIRTFCAERGIHFILTTYPWGHQVNEREWTPGRLAFVPEGAVISDRSPQRVRDFAASSGIEFLDLFPAFRAYNGEAPLYYSFDMHWTPAGHRLLALELQRLIADRP